MIAAECAPLAKVGGLSDVVAGLWRALTAEGHKVAYCLPASAGREIGTEAGEHRLAMRLPLPEPRRVDVRTWSGPAGRFFELEEPSLFGRAGIYGDPATGEGYPDNAERFGVLSAAGALLAAEGLDGFQPDVVHCHDHPAALVPAFLRHGPDPLRARRPVAVVFTIHNLAHQGIAAPALASSLGLEASLMAPLGPLEFHGNVNAMKSAVVLSDRITTVSPRYAEEICRPEFGEGLEGVLRRRRDALRGILNGIDTAVWDPAADPRIPYRYSVERMAGKSRCRRALLEELGLEPAGPRTVVLGMVSRLAAQKGFDLLLEALDGILGEDVRLVILGAGEESIARALDDAAARHGGRLAVRIGFDERLAHRIEAGSNLFLMPSHYEPCGLNQLYSLRYGSIPLVRAVGGLADTVVDLDEDPGRGNGFVFRAPLAAELLKTVRRAVRTFRDRSTWRSLVSRAMSADHSWGPAARSYVQVYEEARQAARTGRDPDEEPPPER
jgi:starch synthase